MVGTPQQLGNANKQAIISLLFENGPMSRADLARKLHLSPPAVTKNIAAVLEAGIIVQIGAGQSESGRKPILLEINGSFRHVIAVDIRERRLCACLADFKKTIVASAERIFAAGVDAAEIIQLATAAIHELLDLRGAEVVVDVIAISVPGIVNKQTGEVTLSTVIPSWDMHNLRDELFSEFHIPVLLENDVDMAILGESQESEYCENMVYIKVGDGVAARLIVNGQLLRGRGNAAGEIGYMLLDRGYTQDRFVSRGALETRICNYAIDKRYKAMKGIADTDAYYSLSAIIMACRNGDSCALELLQDIIDDLCRMIVNIESIVNTEKYILGGDLELLDEAQICHMREYIGRYVPCVPDIVTTGLGKTAEIRGCIHNGISFIRDGIASYLKD